MIKAPYNFVPINKDIFLPDWANQISHDIPFSDGESGIIEIKLTAHSPIFVRNGHTETTSNDTFSNVNNKYFIPATTIKGTIRSVLEIFSFGRLSQYNNDYFSYRDFNMSNYREKMMNIQCGWLQKKPDNQYYLSKRGEPIKITHDEIKSSFRSFNPFKDNALSKQESLRGYPAYNEGRIVCTGRMNGKYHEYIFPDFQKSKITVGYDIIQSFLTVHKSNPIFKTKWLPKIEAGEEIPVFFTQNENNELHSIGLAYNYKYPYVKSVKQSIRQTQDEESKDLSNIIFGYSNGDDSLKGRIHFGHAFTTLLINPATIETVSGVLGEPKASYYPLYLNQNESPYITYDNENSQIAGRKRYRIHETIKQLPQGNNNEKVKNTFKPLPAGTEFKEKIRIHNLRPIELGALLSSILLHKTPDVYHNIGLAKSFGYGKVSFEIETFNGFEHDIDYYLHAFEKELSTFTYLNQGEAWIETEQIKSLMQIASSHTGDDISMMNLNEYKKYKKNSNFSKLSETASIRISSLITKEEKIELTKENFKTDDSYIATYCGGKKAILNQTITEVQCIIPKGKVEPIPGVKIKVMIKQYNKSGYVNQILFIDKL